MGAIISRGYRKLNFRLSSYDSIMEQLNDFMSAELSADDIHICRDLSRALSKQHQVTLNFIRDSQKDTGKNILLLQHMKTHCREQLEHLNMCIAYKNKLIDCLKRFSGNAGGELTPDEIIELERNIEFYFIEIFAKDYLLLAAQTKMINSPAVNADELLSIMDCDSCARHLEKESSVCKTQIDFYLQSLKSEQCLHEKSLISFLENKLSSYFESRINFSSALLF